MFGEVKIVIKIHSGIRTQTNRSIVNPLNHCAMLIGDKIGKETTVRIKLYDL